MLHQCTLHVSYGNDDETPPFVAGKACDACTVVLQGRLHVVCGSEGFESDRGPWTVLGAPTLRQQNYVADFTARVMEPSRLLQIHRDDYEAALKRESQALAAAVRAEAAYHARAREHSGGGGGGFGSVTAGGFGGAIGGAVGAVGGALVGEWARSSSPVSRVACTLAPELASAYVRHGSGEGFRGGSSGSLDRGGSSDGTELGTLADRRDQHLPAAILTREDLLAGSLISPASSSSRRSSGEPRGFDSSSRRASSETRFGDGAGEPRSSSRLSPSGEGGLSFSNPRSCGSSCGSGQPLVRGSSSGQYDARYELRRTLSQQARESRETM